MSVHAYQRARSMVESARATEYRLMSQITGEMISAQSAGLAGAALVPVLHRNREVWTAFRSACAANGNLLPDDVRAGIISIGLWVDRFTSDVVAGRDSVDELIAVNRLVIEGLAGQGAAA